MRTVITAFLVAFLGSDTGYYPQRVYVEEARRLGVRILAPDVNRGGETFHLEWQATGAPGSPLRQPGVRVGLGQVKNLSTNTLERILAAREDGPFLSLPDFLDRTGARTDEAENLIQCGAFDAFDRTRPELLWRLHLLRTPRRRPPPHADTPLDAARLAACRSTPRSRQDESVRAAHAQTGGWSQSGLGARRTPSMRRRVKRGQPARSSMRRARPSSIPGSPSSSPSAGWW